MSPYDRPTRVPSQGVDLRLTKSARLRRAAGLITLAGFAALALASCAAQVNQHPTGDSQAPGFFPGQVVTIQGQEAANLYPIVFAVAAVVFVLVEGLIIWITLRYRRKPTDTALPVQTHGNNKLEVLWIVIPFLVVSGLFVGTYATLADTEKISPTPDVTIDVTAFQWQWTFAYPGVLNAAGQPISFTGAGSTGPEMVLPTGETILFRLHAQDVIHSFFVPQFFRKLDVIPGRVNEFQVVIQDEGTFGGQCAEFCGLGHSQMYFTIRAVSPSDYVTWAAQAQAQANASPEPAPSGAVTVAVHAVSIVAGFDPNTVTAPANTPLTVQFTNGDPAVAHNFAIKAANPDGSDFIGEPPVQGGQTGSFQVPALPAGTYTFYCAIHPNMTGTLKVGG